jgi:hypothetical protein
VGSGSSTSGLVKVHYGVGATSPLLSLGIPQTSTSDMARRDWPRELPSWSDRNVAGCIVMMTSVYESDAGAGRESWRVHQRVTCAALPP